MWIKSLLFTCLVACSASSTTSSSSSAPPASTGTSASTGSATPVATAQGPAQGSGGPGIGETCGTADACAAGLECVSYYGIAGARGPQFKTCEQRCQDDTTCPKERHCATVADGPGRVCR